MTAQQHFLPAGTRLVLDGRTRPWRDGSVVLGGAPWGVVRLGPGAAGLVRRLRAAGDAGVVPTGAADRAAADRLVARGLAHPVPVPPSSPGVGVEAGVEVGVEVVVPVHGRADLLEACLSSLRATGGPRTGAARTGGWIVVVDDASPGGAGDDVARVARRYDVRLLRHEVNRGPAAARTTGLAVTQAPVVAFVDADCVVPPDWLEGLLPLFGDPRVGAVAPRVLPGGAVAGLLSRYEQARSALDMGSRRALVRPGAALGFLPSATLLVRREAVAGGAFDVSLRLGEDVDLVWRLADGGWLVRYEPAVRVRHAMRLRRREWAGRRFAYGTSAAALDRRHPGRLAPARPSAWNLAVLAALVLGRPRTAAVVGAAAAVALARRLHGAGVDPLLAGVVVGAGVVADAVALGHALRREWWPLGWVALGVAAAGRPRAARSARAAAVAVLAPVGLEWVRSRPDVDLLRYAVLRLLEDAAYGSGVITSAVGERRLRVLLPEVLLPGRRRRP